MLKADNFFETKGELFAPLFAQAEYVWEALTKIKGFLDDHLEPNISAVRKRKHQVSQDTVLYQGQTYTEGFLIDRQAKKLKIFMEGALLEGASLIYAGSYLMDDRIYLGRGVVVEPGALIYGPTFIGDHSEVRHAAYVRGQVIIGEGCVVGHTTEIKSSVLLGQSKAGHFAYIGDSILGQVNLGAGTKLANLKMNGNPVNLTAGGQNYKTGLRKFGAVLADGVETGCNSVTYPGTLLGRGAMLYPNTSARGYHPSGAIIRP